MQTKEHFYDRTCIAVSDSAPITWLTPIIGSKKEKDVFTCNNKYYGKIRYYHANRSSGKPKALVIMDLNHTFDYPDMTFTLLDDGYEILCMENIGHGETDKDKKGNYSTANFAAAIYALLLDLGWVSDNQNIEKFGIFSYSFGAQIAAALVCHGDGNILKFIQNVLFIVPTGISVFEDFSATVAKIPLVGTINKTMVKDLANLDRTFSDMPQPILDDLSSKFNNIVEKYEDKVIAVTRYIFSHNSLNSANLFVQASENLAAKKIRTKVLLTHFDRTVYTNDVVEIMKASMPYLYDNLVTIDGFHGVINTIPYRLRTLFDLLF